MFKYIALFLALMLALDGSILAVNAQQSLEYCINTTHKYWEKNINFNGTLYSFNDTINCTAGCVNNQCASVEAENESMDMALVLGLMAAAFFFIYAAFKFDSEKHAPIKIFFIFISIYFVMQTMALMGAIAEMSGDTLVNTVVDNGYNLTYYSLFIFAFYIVIWFIYELFIMMGKIEPIRGREGGRDE